MTKSQLWAPRQDSPDNIINTVITKAGQEEGTDLGVFTRAWQTLPLAFLSCFRVWAKYCNAQVPGHSLYHRKKKSFGCEGKKDGWRKMGTKPESLGEKTMLFRLSYSIPKFSTTVWFGVSLGDMGVSEFKALELGVVAQVYNSLLIRVLRQVQQLATRIWGQTGKHNRTMSQ